MKLNKSIIISLFFLSLSTHSVALEIISPKNNETFVEGDTVSMIAILSPGDRGMLYVDFDVTKSIAKCPNKITTHPRYECSFVIPPGSPSTVEISATGATAQGAIFANWVTIHVTLPSTITLNSITNFPDNSLIFVRSGQKLKLALKGVYSDGVERGINTAVGTVYSSSDERIATVDNTGVVTAHEEGNAKITASNGDKKLDIDVIVDLKP